CALYSPRHPWLTCDSDEASSTRMFGSKLTMDITDAGLIIFLTACATVNRLANGLTLPR
ncbi:hypothetical protein B0O80DRAFT_456039, partial [Mortierella sp. GBAus27b]